MHFFPHLHLGWLNAWLYMSVFLIQMAVIMSTTRKVREKTHLPKELKRTRTEKYTARAANLTWWLSLIYSVFLPFQVETVWFFTGLVVFFLGLILLILATISFTGTPTNQVITKGIYQISRHPMYLSTIIIGLAAGLSSGSILFILITLIMTYCFHKEALIEEKSCLEKYGEEYREYKSRVRRWVGHRTSNIDY